jgi:hypothetical protein
MSSRLLELTAHKLHHESSKHFGGSVFICGLLGHCLVSCSGWHMGTEFALPAYDWLGLYGAARLKCGPQYIFSNASLE